MIARNRLRAATRRLATLLALALATTAAGAGCGGSAAPHGAPVLLKVYWEPWDPVHVSDPKYPMVPLLVWSHDPAEPVASLVPPGPRRVDFVFDKVLDGSKIEDTDGGVQLPKTTDVPIEVHLDDGDAPLPAPYAMSVWYNSIPLVTTQSSEAPGTSYIFGQETPSFPAATKLAIVFRLDAITSKYNEPMVSPDRIVVTSDAFGLIEAPAPAAPPPMILVDYWLPLQFNAVPAALADVQPHVHVSAGGAALPFQLGAEPLDPRRIYVQPADRQIWPSGVPVTVTLDADLADSFGATLGTPKTFTFTPCHASTDAGSGCAPAPDAGAPGGDAAAGSPDAGSDAASDAAPDAASAAPDAGATDDASAAD